jgi:hypothetical protein
MGKLIQAIVRGPENYFDGTLHAPGQIVEVNEDFVSEDDFIEQEIDVPLNPPIVKDGKIIRTAKETIQVRTRFRPLGSMPQTQEGLTTAQIATGTDLAQLNVSDFLKGGADEIVAAVAAGKVDAHLEVIEQQEIARKGPARKAVTDAVVARISAR